MCEVVCQLVETPSILWLLVKTRNVVVSSKVTIKRTTSVHDTSSDFCAFHDVTDNFDMKPCLRNSFQLIFSTLIYL